jgi:hypothetical protein
LEEDSDFGRAQDGRKEVGCDVVHYRAAVRKEYPGVGECFELFIDYRESIDHLIV